MTRMRAIVTARLLYAFLFALAAAGCRRPPALHEVAVFDTPGWAHDVALDGDRLYVSDRQAGYHVYSRAPVSLLTSFTPVKDLISLDPNRGAPLAAARFEGLVALSPAGEPRGRLPLGDDIANAVAARGDFAYVAFGLHGLVVARVGPDGLQLVSSLPTRGWSHDVKLWGERALMADWDYGLRLVDIADAEHPRELAVVPTAATAIDIALGYAAGRPMAAVAEGHGGVALVDLGAAPDLHVVGRATLGLDPRAHPHPVVGGWVHGVAWSGNHVFVANWKRGLAVLDVSEPRWPRVVAQHGTPGTALGVAAEPSGGAGAITVYVADGEAGLRVFTFRP
jgi:hypothetical protein